MSKRRVSPAAVKMAWKMVDTILPRHSVSPDDADRLLNLLTAVALEHLNSIDTLRWRVAGAGGRLRLSRDRVWLDKDSRSILEASCSEGELDSYLDEAEVLLDRYRLDEEEKATLFTALPCLGLSVLQESVVEWLDEPPFPELG